MPHPKHRKQDTRRKILGAAARLFASRGYQATSIEDVMLACGLTRGGFYAHFRSKAQLHDEAVAHAHEATATGGCAGPAATTDWLDDLFNACMAPADARRPELWASLALDVGSSTPEVRRGYARTLTAVRDRLRHELAGAPRDVEAALAVTAMLVGALAVSRTVDDDALRTSMADACREAAQALRERPRVERAEPIFFWAAHEPDTLAHPLH